MVRAKFIIADIIPLPEELRTRYNIVQLPHPLTVDGVEYPNNALPFSTAEFGRMLLAGGHTFETSVTPPPVYAAEYRRTPPGEPIFAICFSPKLGAFHEAARSAAAECPDRDITVIPTRFCPPVMTLWALLAGGLAETAADAAALKAAVLGLGERLGVYHALFSLEYLHQTGRLNTAKALIGRMLKLVPIVTNDAEGYIVPAAKTRLIAKSLERICVLVAADRDRLGGGAVDVLVTWTGSETNGRLLRDLVMQRLSVRTRHFLAGGYSILHYLGPEAAGLAYHVAPAGA
ncbi:MAG: DegV family protein [Planctomycetota bacterium]